MTTNLLLSQTWLVSKMNRCAQSDRRSEAVTASCRKKLGIFFSVWLYALFPRPHTAAHLGSFGVLAGHDGPEASASHSAAPMDMPGDDNLGVWRWDMPDIRQDDLAVGGDAARVCMNCAAPHVVQGVSAAKLQGVWVAFFCTQCSPHLSVRNNAQVPVMWTGPTANITGDLTMLPLYKRCRLCRRWATFGPPGPLGSKRHCRSHAPPSEVPVHRRECEALNCKKRPSYAAVGKRLPLRCASHKVCSDMDVCHSRCISRLVKDGKSVRCWRMPTYGFARGKSGGQTKSGESLEGTGVPRMCWEHQSAGMVQVLFVECRHNGCTAQSTYTRPAERKLSYCTVHRREGDECQGGQEEMGDSTPVAEAFPTFSTSLLLPNITLSSSRRHRYPSPATPYFCCHLSLTRSTICSPCAPPLWLPSLKRSSSRRAMDTSEPMHMPIPTDRGWGAAALTRDTAFASWPPADAAAESVTAPAAPAASAALLETVAKGGGGGCVGGTGEGL